MALVVPTYFTAVDKSVTSTVNTMGANIQNFAMKAEAGLNRAERAFNKIVPSVSNASKQVLSFLKTTAVLAAFALTANAIKDYDANLAELRAITGATGSQFIVFKKQIEDSAIAQKMSTVEMAKAFTIVGNAQPQLLGNAEGLSAVANATITLARASRMELAPAADALTTIMNQFSHSSDQAAKDIDIISAASRAGSMEIFDLSEALKDFGTVAASNKISLLESATLAELGSQFDKTGAAGIKYRNILLKMSAIKLEPGDTKRMIRKTGVDLDIVSNKALPFSVRFQEMAKILKSTDATMKLFGERNVALATGVLSNAGSFDSLMAKVNETGVAQQMAAENSSSLESAMNRVTASFVNYFTIGDKVNSGLEIFKGLVNFSAKNMDTLLNVTIHTVAVFAAWWALMKVVRIALFAYSVIVGINAGLTATYSVALKGNAVALAVANAATWLMTAAQWELNAAMDANPIGLIILAIAALIAALSALYHHVDGWGDQWDSMWSYNLAVLDAFESGFHLVWDGIKDYFATTWDGMVDIYQRAQVAMGFMSAKTLLENQQQRFKDNMMRKQEIADQAELFKLYSMRASTKLEWKLKWHNSDSTKGEPAEVADTQHQRNLNMMSQLRQEIKTKLEVTVKAAPGTAAAVTNGGGNDVIPTSSSTMMPYRSPGVQ